MYLWPLIVLSVGIQRAEADLNVNWYYICNGASVDKGSVTVHQPFDDHWVPFKALYVMDPRMSDANKVTLQKAANRVNERLAKVLSSKPLRDVRMARDEVAVGPGGLAVVKKPCLAATCRDLPIPEEYVLPCPADNKTGFVEAMEKWNKQTENISTESSQGQPDVASFLNKAEKVVTDEDETMKKGNASDIEQPNKENYTVVIFVYMYGDGYDDDGRGGYCSDYSLEYGYNRTIGTGHAMTCQGENWNNNSAGRPSHGAMILCQRPEKIHEEMLASILLHHTIHVLLWNFTVAGKNVKQCDDEAKCENNTWRKIKQRIENYPHINFAERHVIQTTNVKKAAMKHFNCESVEGAELNVKRSRMVGQYGNMTEVYDMDGSHWNPYLFSDDIMSPHTLGEQRLSEMTLAVLADSGWYQANMDMAEPSVISRPDPKLKLGCEFAKDSFYATMQKIQTQYSGKVVRAAPTCVQSADSIENYLCSMDGQIRLICYHDLTLFRNPSIGIDNVITPVEKLQYDYPHCGKATRVSDDERSFGSRIGNDTMCLTFVARDVHYYKEVSHESHCIEYKCLQKTAALQFTLRPPNRNSTEFDCLPGDSNTLKNITIAMGSWDAAMAVICPDFNRICPGHSTTTHAPFSTTTTSPINMTTNSPVTVATTWPVPGTTTPPGPIKTKSVTSRHAATTSIPRQRDPSTTSASQRNQCSVGLLTVALFGALPAFRG